MEINWDNKTMRTFLLFNAFPREKLVRLFNYLGLGSCLHFGFWGFFIP